LKNQDRTSHWEGTLSAFVDGVATPLRVRAQDLRRRENRGRDEVLAVELASEGSELVLDLFMKFDPEKDAFVLALEGVPSPDIFPHDVALGVTLPLQKEDIFVSGVGPVGDIAEVMGRLALLGSEPQSVGFVSLAGPLDVQVRGEPRFEGGLAVDVKSPKAREGRAVLALAMAPTESRLFENLYALGSMETREVQGMVTGTEERARVFSLDESGAPQLRVSTDERGQFRLQAPAEASSWYATAGETLTSEPVEWNPTAETPLVIDVSPGGELRAVVRDADLGQAVTARLFVKGLDGTPDPNFGPDYRASGAGVLVDSLRGAFVTPLPAGRYRVSGTRGLEYSVDSKDVEVRSGRISKVELDLRRVAPTPGALGCDLHVHARPSFDSPVTPEDRVLSLVAAGIEFAVPTEHNVVGDYGPSLDLLGLSRELLWVPGVEVTTYSPRFGHVGVFPYPPGGVLPTKARPWPPSSRPLVSGMLRASCSSITRACPMKLATSMWQAGRGAKRHSLAGFVPILMPLKSTMVSTEIPRLMWTACFKIGSRS
jgi:hypothetical protein